MAKPYSDDFRQKVMQAIELDGLKKSEASQLFNISRNTINLWFQRQAATGDIKPKPPPDKYLNETSKSTIGRSFRILSKLMGIKPRVKWQNCGMRRLANPRFRGH
jgi:transposase-like protein